MSPSVVLEHSGPHVEISGDSAAHLTDLGTAANSRLTDALADQIRQLLARIYFAVCLSLDVWDRPAAVITNAGPQCDALEAGLSHGLEMDDHPSGSGITDVIWLTHGRHTNASSRHTS